MITIDKPVSGNVFYDGKMRKGTLQVRGDSVEFREGWISNNSVSGTIIPALINAHTHIGDSFITIEPEGDIKGAVGPGGFKEKQYESASQAVVRAGMRRSMKFMSRTGTSAFIDFREGGYSGSALLRNIRPEPKPIILGRPLSTSDGTLGIADGAGMSAILDHDAPFMRGISEECRRSGKLFALHLSERIREDIDAALALKPDLLVHCLECTDQDLDMIASAGIPVAITPRSNVFFGKRKDYSMFMRHGITLLLGTDNVMTVEPDMFGEMGFLFTWQRSINRLSPDNIISMATENPRKFINRRGLGPESFQYLFFRGLRLSSYELVSKAHMFRFSFARLIL